MADLEFLKSEHERLKSLFQRFHTLRRDQYRKVIGREMPITLPEELKPYWADMQDPILEETLNNWIGVLKIDQTKIDFIPTGSEAQKYKEKVEEARGWFNVSQIKLNKGRWRDQYIAEGQIVDGVAIIFEGWHLPEEPDEDQDRDEYYCNLEPWLFEHEGIDSMQCVWDGQNMEQPSIFMQEAERRYYGEFTRDGKRLRLTDADTLVIVGKDETVDAGTTSTEKKLKFLKAYYQDPKTDKHVLCTYVYPEGNWGGGQTVYEDEVPSGRCPWYVIPSGNINMHATDPHLRYRPSLLALTDWVYKKNFIMTILAAEMQWAISDAAIGISPKGMSPELLSSMENVGFKFEGAGAANPPSYDKPELAVGTYAVVPGEPFKWPKDISQQAATLLAECNNAIAELKRDRFAAGTTPDNVLSQAPARSLSINSQAQRLPFGRELVHNDEFTRQSIEAQKKALIYFDDGKAPGAQRPYGTIAPQDLNYVNGGMAKAGQKFTVSAELLKTHNWETIVQTGNQTDNERAVEEERALNRFHNGVTDDLQLYKEMGFEDPFDQRKVMAKYEARKMHAMTYQPFLQQNINQYFAATAGLNPEIVAQGAMGGQAAPQPVGAQESAMHKDLQLMPQGAEGGSSPMQTGPGVRVG